MNRLVLIGVSSMMVFSFEALSQSSTHTENALADKPKAQTTIDDFVIPGFFPLSFLLTYFPSELIGNGIELKSYVRSIRFRAIRRRFGDLRAVDALYIRALRLTHGNSGMALLYCTLATMDHRIVGIKNPFIKAFAPLTSESQEEFLQRVDNLPAHFYSDSPRHRSGDRDKLQHFFGSAFIAKAFESRGAAERVGLFVEWGEDAFILDGALDERDMRANRQGREFGLALIGVESLQSVLPSYFLKLGIAKVQKPSALDIPYSSFDITPRVTNIEQACPPLRVQSGRRGITNEEVPIVQPPTRCGVW
jgi:hypothetical protein